MRRIVRRIDNNVPKLSVTFGHNYTSDAFVGPGLRHGNVSLEQKTGGTYHSSADTPEVLNARVMKWAGKVATAYLYVMSRIDNDDLVRLASAIRRRALRSAKSGTDEASLSVRRAVRELASLQGAMSVPSSYIDAESPEDYYAAGVKRSSGCWPQVEQRRRVAGMLADVRKAAAASTTPDRRPRDSVRREAESLVPAALDTGFLSFEDCFKRSVRKELRERVGLGPSWGTYPWAWMLHSRMRGKRTVAELVDELAALGVETPMDQAVALTRFLAKRKRVRLRPVLSEADLAEALKQVGVRRGSVLAVHASLSRFGYMRGGAEAFVRGLRKALGPRGTLAMPTHSNSVLGAPPYDRKHSPSNTGAVTEYFRRRSGALRSVHPTHSVAAEGPMAETLLAGVRPDQAPLAREGFWGALYDAGGDVLLMCPVRSATLLHAGETWIDLPQAPLIAHALNSRGRRRVYVLPNGPWHVNHFEPTMVEPLLRRGIMRRAEFGESTILRGPAKAMADISVEVNRRNPRVSLGRGGTCDCHYCRHLKEGLRSARR